MSEENLCSRDLSILNLIFDRSFVEKEVKDYKQPVIDESDSKDIEEENSEAVLSSRKLELEGVELAEAGKLEEALEKFNNSVEIAKQRPSPYNNRAQLYRFIEKDDLALLDLSRSIELCGESFNLTKCRALCQRGIIKRKFFCDLTGARDDFNESAKLGSRFARQQLIELNPYAQLCNQMVTKLLTEMN